MKLLPQQDAGEMGWFEATLSLLAIAVALALFASILYQIIRPEEGRYDMQMVWTPAGPAAR